MPCLFRSDGRLTSEVRIPRRKFLNYIQVSQGIQVFRKNILIKCIITSDTIRKKRCISRSYGNISGVRTYKFPSMYSFLDSSGIRSMTVLAYLFAVVDFPHHLGPTITRAPLLLRVNSTIPSNLPQIGRKINFQSEEYWFLNRRNDRFVIGKLYQSSLVTLSPYLQQKSGESLPGIHLFRHLLRHFLFLH